MLPMRATGRSVLRSCPGAGLSTPRRPRQSAQVLGEAAGRTSVAAVRGRHGQLRSPVNAHARGLETVDQFDVLTRLQRTEAADTPVRVGAEPHVRAVNV